jgi:hypothetical protein
MDRTMIRPKLKFAPYSHGRGRVFYAVVAFPFKDSKGKIFHREIVLYKDGSRIEAKNYFEAEVKNRDKYGASGKGEIKHIGPFKGQ